MTQKSQPPVDFLQNVNPGDKSLCSGAEAGSDLRLIDFVYHSTLGVRVIKKRRRYLHAR